MKEGFLDFIDHLTKDKGDIVGDNSIFYTKKEYDGVIVEISFKYTEAYNETILGYVNNITLMKAVHTYRVFAQF